MKKASFRDQYIMEQVTADITNNLAQVLGGLSFTNLETTIKSSTTLFNDTQDNVEAWQKNIDEWNKQLSKTLKAEADYVSKEKCETWFQKENGLFWGGALNFIGF